MSPEQARGEALDHRSDLFSLGTVLYTMASGRPPFRASNTVAVLKRVCEDIPRSVPDVQSECPQWLDDIISKLHAKEAADRYQSGQEVVDVMQQCLTSPPNTTSSRRRNTKAQKKRPGTRKSAAFAGITLTSLAVVAVLAIWRPWESSNSDRPPGVVATEPAKQTETPAVSDAELVSQSPITSIAQPVPANVTNNESSWTSLFDGTDTSAWSTLGPFEVRGGTLVANGKEGNAVSRDQFSDFELEAEWKVGPAGNGGIYYRELPVTKAAAGNEYQMLDDAAYAAKQPANMTTGSIYGLIAPTSKAARPTGEWNKTRIVCNGTIVEHWLNDQKVVSYDTASDAWKKLIANSTWAGKTTVGVRPRGHLLLQGLGGEIAFKSIRIRQISSNPAISANAIPVLPPLAGSASLVPRPQFIPGLKSWDMVRPFPVGGSNGIFRLSDGRFVTSCFNRPGIHVHGADLQIQ